MVLAIDSIRYHCEIHANHPDRPWLLMLHGFMGSGRTFSHLFEELKQVCNPVTIDLAGHGKTIAPANPVFYSVQRQKRQLFSIISRLALHPLYLYGYSMGGRLAFQLLAAKPTLFRGVMIESAHCGIISEDERAKRKASDASRAEEIRKNYPAFVENWQKQSLFRAEGGTTGFGLRETMIRQNAECMAASLLGFGAGVMRPVCHQLSTLEVPTLLIAGEMDLAYLSRMETIAATNPRFKRMIASGAGHRVHQDRPEEVSDAILHFVNRSESADVPEES